MGGKKETFRRGEEGFLQVCVSVGCFGAKTDEKYGCDRDGWTGWLFRSHAPGTANRSHHYFFLAFLVVFFVVFLVVFFFAAFLAMVVSPPF